LERQERLDHDSEASCEGHSQAFAVGAELFGSVCRKDLKNLPTAVGRIFFKASPVGGILVWPKGTA
jgi:hypothetical protein